MRKVTAIVLTLCLVLTLAGCVSEPAATPVPASTPTPAPTPTPTPTPEPPYIAETYSVEGGEPYYKMSDGTWTSEGYTYKYKFELTGRLPNAKVDSTYVVLSNAEDITFEMAYKSRVSSNFGDFFDESETRIVDSRKGEPDPQPVTTYSTEGGKTYHAMSDNTWLTEDGEEYKLRYVLTGTHPESDETVTYVVLSSRTVVTFEEAYAAAEGIEEQGYFEVVATIPAE